MAYCTRANIEGRFGVDNINKWADLDNAGSTTDVTARINAAIAAAEDDIDTTLRGGPYVIPFAGTPPVTIRDLCADLAGVWLYESRGVVDFDPETGRPHHRLQWHRKNAKRVLAELHGGKRQLDLTSTLRAPNVVAT